MNVNRMNIGRLEFVYDVYGDSHKDVFIRFEEYQQDPWYSANEVYVDINENDAKEIINFLKIVYPNI